MKTFRAFRYVYKHYFDDFDWFMRTDDDSYVIMENLRYFLSMQDTNKAVHFGHKFKVIVRSGYFAGGPGVIFSKEALKRFSSSEGVKLCPEADKGVDDVNIGLCMEHLREHISHYANWTMFKSIRTPLLHSKIRVYKGMDCLYSSSFFLLNT